jgi:hypothetical protein
MDFPCHSENNSFCIIVNQNPLFTKSYILQVAFGRKAHIGIAPSFLDRFTEVSLSGNSVMAQGSRPLFTVKHFSLLPFYQRQSWRVFA